VAPLIPCAVVVDSRNLIGQANRMFGAPSPFTVAGIRQALIGYGLDAIEVRVGMATRVPQKTTCSQQVTSMCQKNGKHAAALVAEGAQVLHGYLVERGDKVEEKQVDVLCAVAVADLAERIALRSSSATCIVCISEDMDLMPAYDFAYVRGVPVFAAAIDTVHVRGDQRSWLLLDEAAIDSACPSTARYRGSRLRAWTARIALEASQVAGLWTVGHRTKDGLYEMSRNNGARGFWCNDAGLRGGEKVTLYATGVVAEPRTRRFPQLHLSVTPPTGPFANVERAVVKFWVAQNRVKVGLASGDESTVSAPTGCLLPGQEVAVLRGDGGSLTFIGELDRGTIPETWPAIDSVRRAIARVTGGSSRSWARGRLEDGDQEIAIALKGVTLQPGDRLAVSLVGVHPTWRIPSVHPMSSPLPAIAEHF
jgi:hypothetical protein